MSSNRSRGSILGFVIVGILLLGLIAGAVYAVRSGVFGGGNTPEIADETIVDPATESTGENKPANETKTDELSEALKKQSEAEKKAKEQSQAVNSEQKTATQNGQTNQPSATTPQQQPTTATPRQLATTGVTSTQLPQTGPAEDALTMVLGAGLVGTAAVAYRRSRSLI